MKANKTWIVTGSLAAIVVAGIAGAATAQGDRVDRPFGPSVVVPGYASPGSKDSTTLPGPEGATDSALTPGEALTLRRANPTIGKTFGTHSWSTHSAASPEVAPAPAPVVVPAPAPAPAPAQNYSAASPWSADSPVSAASAWSAPSADSGD